MNLKLLACVFISICAVGCDDCSKNPLTPSYISSNRSSIWLHPNVGSTDFIAMFKEGRENDWAEARSKIKVFQFHHGNLLRGSCAPHCGFNNENNFVNIAAARPGGPFAWLNQQGIAIAFEAGSVKQWHCDIMPDDTIASALEAIRNIESTGGMVSFISMDEPFTGLSFCPGKNDTLDEAAEKTKYFINGVKAAAPGVDIGLTEAYPYRTEKQIITGINLLKAKGVQLAYLNLDIDINHVRNDNIDPTVGLREIKDFCKNQGLPLGAIIGSGLGLSNETYFNDAMHTAQMVRMAIGTPDRLIFESWSDYPPTRINPENDHYNLRLYPDNIPETKEATLTWIQLRISQYFGL